MAGQIKSGQSAVKKQLLAMGLDDQDLIEIADNDIDAKNAIESTGNLMNNGDIAVGVNFVQGVKEEMEYGGDLIGILENRDKKSDLGPMTKLRHAASMLEDARRVNPNYDQDHPRTTNNCGLCSMAYDLRRRGYDAYAGLSESGTTFKDILKLYPGTKKVTRFGEYAKSASVSQPPMKSSDVSKVINSFSRESGTRGTLLVSWGYTGGGHAMSYEVSSSGALSIIDPQSGNVYSGKSLNKFLRTVASVDTFRLDNVEPDIEQMMRRHLVL